VEVGQGTVAEILPLVGLGGPHITHSKIWTPSPRISGNWEKKLFWGWAAQEGLGPKFNASPDLGRGNH